MKITLYTIHCPACNILEEKLQKKGLVYETVDDIKILTELGLASLPFPLLQVNQEPIMKYKEAVIWVNGQEDVNG